MGKKIALPLFLLSSLLLIALLQYGYLLLLLALLPSLMAYFVDYEPGKPAFKTVLASNLASALPTLTPVLRMMLKMKHYDLSSVMGDGNMWVFIYCGAAVGWALLFTCRYLARFIISMECSYKVASLQKFQGKLLDEWGPQVQPGSQSGTLR